MCLVEHCTNATVVTLNSLPEPSEEAEAIFAQYQVDSLKGKVPAVYTCNREGKMGGLAFVRTKIEEPLSPATHEHAQTRYRDLLVCPNPVNPSCRGYKKNNSRFIEQ
ncbi:MAG: hypothetical protein WCG44_04435 [bacterium]